MSNFAFDFFQCVILTEVPMTVQVQVNKFCRQQTPQIRVKISSSYFQIGILSLIMTVH